MLVFALFIHSSLQASTVATPTKGVLAAATVPTLAPVIQLSIVNSGGNAQLSWLDGFATFAHQVHRSTTPFFSPTSGTLLTTVNAGVNTFTDATSGIGNVGTNHFYLVTANLSSGTFYSNWVGEIDYSLKNSNGAYSLIGIPFLSPSPNDAASLATQIGNVSTVLGWNRNTQSFRTFTPNTGNFTFSPGDAIFVQVLSGAPASVNVVGRLDRAAIGLTAGGYNFITMPLHCDEVSDASSTASDIGDVANLLSWIGNTQSFRVFTPPSTGNFSLPVGSPFIVELGAGSPASWPTSNDACK
ncbi:MAG: hypothetical protein R3E79_20815 [Caldilineaceae bacterium]